MRSLFNLLSLAKPCFNLPHLVASQFRKRHKTTQILANTSLVILGTSSTNVSLLKLQRSPQPKLFCINILKEAGIYRHRTFSSNPNPSTASQHQTASKPLDEVHRFTPIVCIRRHAAFNYSQKVVRRAIALPRLLALNAGLQPASLYCYV